MSSEWKHILTLKNIDDPDGQHMMRRTPQFMRNYLAKCEEINVELTHDPYDNCVVSKVSFPIRWVAPTPKNPLLQNFISCLNFAFHQDLISEMLQLITRFFP